MSVKRSSYDWNKSQNCWQKTFVPVRHESESSKPDRWHQQTRRRNRRMRRLRRQGRTARWPNQPVCHVQKNPSQNINTTVSNWTVHHKREAAEAGIASFLWRLQGLDVFLRPFQWSSEKQQPGNRQSNVAMSKNFSERRRRKAFDLSPNHRRKLQYNMRHPEEQIRQRTSDFMNPCSCNSSTEAGNKWKPKGTWRSHRDCRRTQISVQQTWTARRGRPGHLFRLPHCRENARRNEKMLETFINRKKSPTLSWFEKFHGRKNTRFWSSHTAVSINHRQEAHKQPATSKIPFTYSHTSDYNVWMLRRKPQNLSMPKFQNNFSTGPSSVDQNKRTLLQLPTPWTSKWTMQRCNL